MGTTTSLSTNTAADTQDLKRQTTDLKGLFTSFIYHWPLFLISIIIALTGLLIYLKLCNPVHEVKAMLQIQDEKKSTDRHSALKEIDLSSSSTIIENEMAVLESKALISKMVDQLQLWVGVQRKDGLFYRDAYGQEPFKLEVKRIGTSSAEGEIYIRMQGTKSFLMGPDANELQEYPFNQMIRTAYGQIQLSLTKGIVPLKGQELKINFSDPEQTALYYQKAIEISMPNKLATTVSLSLKDAVAQRGKDVLNQLIYQYKQAGTLEKQSETRRTLAFLDERIGLLTHELTDAEKGIESFRVVRGLTDISSESKIGLENMQANDTRLNEVQLQLSVIRGIEKFMNAPQNVGKAPATLGITDPALSSMIERYSQLQLQREKMLAIMPETNPDFEPLNRQIASARQAISDNVKSMRISLQNTASSLQGFNSQFASTIKNIPSQEREYISIKRQQAIKENLYNYLLQKREEVAVSYAATLTDDRIIDQAYATPAKVPQKPLAVVAALMFGLVLPAGVLYSRGALKPTLTDLHQVKRVFGTTVLAEIPFETIGDSRIINGTRTSPLIDHLRALRIKLGLLYGGKDKGRVTLITSSIPTEGKSFLSSNLGATIAMSGRKTIILEMDMRKPKLAGMFNVSASHLGISEYLTGALRPEEVIQKVGKNSNLDVITSGATAKNSSELLEGDSLNLLISHLKESYDDIIIDSPPVHLVPDALLLSRYADFTLYVIRQGVTGKEEVRFIKDLQEQKQLNNMKLVFNGILRQKYGYGYSYDGNYDYDNYKKLSLFSNLSDRF